MKWLRRLLLIAAILLCIVIAATLVGLYLYRSTPSWYRRSPLSEQERKAAANRADQKLADVISWAADVQAQQVRRHRGTASSTESPVGPKTVTLAQDELNAFFDSWSGPQKSQFQRRFSRYFSDGRLVLTEGQIILAGQSSEMGTLASVQLQPSIDGQGHLRLQWNGVSAGLLPVPESAIAGRLQRLQALLREQLDIWQESADIDQTLTANASAVEATMTKLLLDAINNRASDPLFFVPFDLGNLRHALPVRLSAVEVGEGTITMTLQPLPLDDRMTILRGIQRPYPPRFDDTPCEKNAPTVPRNPHLLRVSQVGTGD